jgi:hypothetical protein
MFAIFKTTVPTDNFCEKHAEHVFLAEAYSFSEALAKLRAIVVLETEHLTPVAPVAAGGGGGGPVHHGEGHHMSLVDPDDNLIETSDSLDVNVLDAFKPFESVSANLSVFIENATCIKMQISLCGHESKLWDKLAYLTPAFQRRKHLMAMRSVEDQKHRLSFKIFAAKKRITDHISSTGISLELYEKCRLYWDARRKHKHLAEEFSLFQRGVDVNQQSFALYCAYGGRAPVGLYEGLTPEIVRAAQIPGAITDTERKLAAAAAELQTATEQARKAMTTVKPEQYFVYEEAYNELKHLVEHGITETPPPSKPCTCYHFDFVPHDHDDHDDHDDHPNPWEEDDDNRNPWEDEDDHDHWSDHDDED